MRTLLGISCLLASASAHAHFALEAPPSWQSQDGLGSPQKAPPCGNESGGTPTGTVTPFSPGQTITITIDEKIFHPGHYRVALAQNDRSELPAEPTVTPNTTDCGSVPIMDPPVYPVLADGLLVHTAPMSGPQSVQVTLPSNVTCTKCTLQVIEFMSDHALNVPGGCFYHHCADISIGAASGDAGMPRDGGAATDAATANPAGDGGCALSRGTPAAGAVLLLLAALSVMGLRRVQRAPR